jgi:hypothetical protein
VCFTPGTNGTELMVNAIGEAEAGIPVPAYRLTFAPIAKTRLDAHRRGMRVEVMLDKSQRSEPDSSADLLASQGVPHHD